jgi:hypothetical protein
MSTATPELDDAQRRSDGLQITSLGTSVDLREASSNKQHPGLLLNMKALPWTAFSYTNLFMTAD